jgi:hypothetical protein
VVTSIKIILVHSGKSPSSEPQIAQANNRPQHPQYAGTRAVSNPAIKQSELHPPLKQQLTNETPSYFDLSSLPWTTPLRPHKTRLHRRLKYSFSFDKPLLLRVIHISFPSKAAAAPLVNETDNVSIVSLLLIVCLPFTREH